MTLATKYDPSNVEDKWYQFWLEKGYFKSVPDNREPYTIVIPPPNVTGVLHMGHMLNNTIQDVLIRKARMEGKNALWVPGTDHASIATEAKVVKMLAEKGISKKEIGREAFLEHAFEWKEKYGGIILEQLKKLGASCDWDRTRFTMEPSLYNAVIDVFIDLYQKGLIYRDTKMVNWDPLGKTTLSDEEVIFKPSKSKMVYLRYAFEDGSGHLVVATVRPETIMGDVAIAVHPEDPRYKNLLGKKVLVPLIHRAIPIIADESIEQEFGTGCLKVTPAHDFVDYQIGKKHGLEIIDVLNEDGTLSEAAQILVGVDRFKARTQILQMLEEAQAIEKMEDYQNNLGYSERTDAVVEPRVSTQWFMDMEKFMNKNPQVLEDVLNDTVAFHPAKLKNTYKHWIANIKEWNISRQLWWGHRIPAWYAPDGSYVIAKNEDDALVQFTQKGIEITKQQIKQDPDVLDTWFSSWLWPISVFDGFDPNNDKKELNYYYPTNTLVTAPEIIFFWVARMIMAGYEYMGQKPFKDVYFTGIVRDKQRRKMSKSLGNSPDPLDLIATHGADAVRLGMMLCASAGNDVLYDESQIEQGRNFANKIWNAFRLIQGWEGIDKDAMDYENTAIEWFEWKLNATIEEVEKSFSDFRLNDAIMAIYKLIWDDFCSLYLEAIKPGYQQPIANATLENTKKLFGELMALLHPFMPFITEELYAHLKDHSTPLIISPYPKKKNEIIESSDKPFELIREIRNVRASKGISPKELLPVSLQGADTEWIPYKTLVEKMGNVSLNFDLNKPENAVMVLVGTQEAYIGLPNVLDKNAELSRLKEEINYLQGFLKSVDQKLSNERFVANAKPDVVEKERQKKADTEDKIKTLEMQLKNLN